MNIELVKDAERSEDGFYPILVNGKQEKAPSVTKLIRPQFGYTTEAMARGTAIHNALYEIIFNGKDILKVVDNETKLPVENFIRMITELKIEPIVGEVVRVGTINGLNYVGRIDLVGIRKNIPIIKDFKSQEKPTDRLPDDTNLDQAWLYARAEKPNERQELYVDYEDGYIQKGVYDPENLATEPNRYLHTFYDKVDGWYWQNGGCYRKKTTEQEEVLLRLEVLLQENKYYEKERDAPKAETKPTWALNRVYKEEAQKNYIHLFDYKSKIGSVNFRYSYPKDRELKLPAKTIGRVHIKEAIEEAKENVKRLCAGSEMRFRQGFLSVYETKPTEWLQFKCGKKEELIQEHPEWFFLKDNKEIEDDE